MSQEFYNLEEAAKKLGLTTQELNAMAQHREIRAFADRGTWRFRTSDVDELATRRGFVSNPNFRLSDPDVGADVKGPGSNLFAEESAKAKAKATKDLQGKKSGDTGKVDLGSIAGEEDDVPSSSSFVFGNKPVPGLTDAKGPDSGDDESKVPLGRDTGPIATGDSRVRLDSPSGRLPDMGVHLVDFNMKPISDPPSSRKLVPPPIPGTGSGPIKAGDSGRVVAGGSGRIPQPPKKDTGKVPPAAKTQGGIGSSEYELRPTDKGPQDSIFDFSTPSMDSIELEVPSGAMDFVDIGTAGQPPEQGGSMRAKLPPMKEDSDSFELNLDPSSGDDMSAFSMATPTPRPVGKPKDTSSEFDLSLQLPEQSSSDFELSVDDESSGTMSALDSSADKSGSSTARIPTEDVQVGEDSDFELALDDDAVVDETGSEVVVIDEEGTEPMSAAGAVADEEAVVEPYADEEEVEEVAPGRTAEWGWLSLLHLPTVLIMIFTGLLLFEMVRSISGYETKSTYTGAIYELVKKAWAGS